MSDNVENLGIRISAEGVPETTSGINLVSVAVDKMAQTLPGASTAFRGLGGSLAGTGEALATTALRAAAATGPLGALLGIVAGGIVIHELAAREAQAYAKALIMTGNAAGETAADLAVAARAISQTVGTQGKAAEALTALAATGEVARANMQAFAEVAVRMERNLGDPIEKTAEKFELLGRAPLDASVKLNRGLNYLTAAIYDEIRALQAEGKYQEAGAVAQKAYADAMSERAARVGESLGTLQRMWRSLADAGKSAWDAMLDVGRPATLDRQLADVKASIGNMQRLIRQDGDGAQGRWAQGRMGDLEQRQAAINRSMLNAAEQATSTAEQIAQQQAELRERERANVAASIAIELAQASSAAAQREALAQQDLARARAIGVARESLLRAQSATLENARSQDMVGLIDYYERRTALEQRGLAIEIANIDAEMKAERAAASARAALLDARLASESKRKPENPAEAAQQQAKLIELEGQRQALAVQSETRIIGLQAQRGRLTSQQAEAAVAGERALANASAEATDRWLADVERRRQALAQLNDQQRRSNEMAAADLIADPYVRAVEKSRIRVDELNRYYSDHLAGLKARLPALDATDPDKAAAVRRQIVEAERQKNDAIVLADRQLTEDLKPEWQKQLEAWRDHTRLMRESFDEFQNGWLQSGEQAWMDYMRTGKLSVSGIADFAKGELGRVIFRSTIAEPFAQLGQSIASAFGLGSGGSGNTADTAARAINTTALQSNTAALLQLAASMGVQSATSGASGLTSAATSLGGSSIFSSIGTWVSDFIGSIGIWGLASGGNAAAGSLHEVNERGPELLTVNNRTYLMMGGKDGFVTPNGGAVSAASAGGSSVVFSPTIHIDSRTDQAQVAQLVRQAVRSGQAELLDMMSRGMA